MLPFSLKYSTQLTNRYTPKDMDMILEYIKNHIITKSADDITIEENTLKFKVKFLKWGRSRGNIFTSLEKGTFEIINKENKSFLTYKIYMYRALLIATGFLIFIFFVSKGNREPFIIVSCVVIINWIITIIRHWVMLNDIKNKINNFTAGADRLT